MKTEQELRDETRRELDDLLGSWSRDLSYTQGIAVFDLLLEKNSKIAELTDASHEPVSIPIEVLECLIKCIYGEYALQFCRSKRSYMEPSVVEVPLR